jgi:integrase
VENVFADRRKKPVKPLPLERRRCFWQQSLKAKKAPVLSAFVVRFMSYVDNAKLADKSKSYLRNGWRLLERTSVAGMRLDHITAEDIDALPLPGGPCNVNCALKTLRRMLHKAEEWGLIAKVPKLKLLKEFGRNLRLDQEAERKLLAAADSLLERGAWTRKMHDTFRDVVVLVRDAGMRNKKELFCARIEDIDWNNRVFFIPDSKTDNGRRFVPLSDRAHSTARPILRASRFRNQGAAGDRQSCGCHARHGARQSINGNEVSTSRTRAGAPCLEWHKRQSQSRAGIVMAHSTAQ